MASPVDLLRPPISEVRLETTQGLLFWNIMECTAIWEAMLAKCKVCWNGFYVLDSLWGPLQLCWWSTAFTLEEHRPVDTDGLARCWILPLSRLSPSETEAYQTEEWLQCQSSSLRAVLGEFMWIPSADTWFFREMHCGYWMGSRDALKQSTLFFVSLCFTVLGSISMNLYFWWSDQEKSSWSISIRLRFAHGSPLWVSRQGAHLHSEQEDGATNSFGNLAQHFAASSFCLMRRVLMPTTVGRKGFVDQWIWHDMTWYDNLMDQLWAQLLAPRVSWNVLVLALPNAQVSKAAVSSPISLFPGVIGHPETWLQWWAVERRHDKLVIWGSSLLNHDLIKQPYLSPWSQCLWLYHLGAVRPVMKKKNGARKVASVHELSISNTSVKDMWSSMTQLSLTDRRFTDAMAQTFVPKCVVPKCANHVFFIDTLNHWKLKVQKTRPGQFCSSTLAILTPKMRKVVDKIELKILLRIRARWSSLFHFSHLFSWDTFHYISSSFICRSLFLPDKWTIQYYTHFYVKNLLSCAQCTKTKGLHGRVGCFALFGCSLKSLIHSSWLMASGALKFWDTSQPLMLQFVSAGQCWQCNSSIVLFSWCGDGGGTPAVF